MVQNLCEQAAAAAVTGERYTGWVASAAKQYSANKLLKSTGYRHCVTYHCQRQLQPAYTERSCCIMRGSPPVLVMVAAVWGVLAVKT
jgi:hypothetical protein